MQLRRVPVRPPVNFWSRRWASWRARASSRRRRRHPDRTRQAGRARRLRVERRARDRQGRGQDAAGGGRGDRRAPADRARVAARPRRASRGRGSSTCVSRPRSGCGRLGDPRRRRRLGAGRARPAPKIVLEYLSANPTGPITVAHGRHAAVGDSMTRLMRFAGYPVTPEYYINDAGNQVEDADAVGLDALHGDRARGRPAVPEVGVSRERLQGRVHPRLRPRSLRARRQALGRAGAARRRRSRSSSSRWSARWA